MVSVSYNGATVAYYRPRATIPAFSLIKKKSKAFSLRSVLIWFTRTYNEGCIIIYNVHIYPCRCVYVPLAVYFSDTPEDIIVTVSSLATLIFLFWPLSTSLYQYALLPKYLGA